MLFNSWTDITLINQFGFTYAPIMSEYISIKIMISKKIIPHDLFTICPGAIIMQCVLLFYSINEIMKTKLTHWFLIENCIFELWDFFRIFLGKLNENKTHRGSSNTRLTHKSGIATTEKIITISGTGVNGCGAQCTAFKNWKSIMSCSGADQPSACN